VGHQPERADTTRLMAEDQRVEGPSSICGPAVVAPVLLVKSHDCLGPRRGLHRLRRHVVARRRPVRARGAARPRTGHPRR